MTIQKITESVDVKSRNIFLIRHGRIKKAGDVKRFIGQTDYDLLDESYDEMSSLKEYLKKNRENITKVYSSPMIRCIKTAEYIFEVEITIEENLKEINMGEWENKTFGQVLEKFPEEFDERGRNIGYYKIKDAESYCECQKRAVEVFERMVQNSTGDIAIVTHAGIIKSLLCYLLKIDINKILQIKQSYGALNVLKFKNEEYIAKGINLSINDDLNIKDKGIPERNECDLIRIQFNMPEDIKLHCDAVCNNAVKITDECIKNGHKLNKELIIACSLLHDIARNYKNHALKGGEWLEKAGYYQLKPVIIEHMSLSEKYQNSINEASILYLADKTVIGDKVCSIEERFANKLEKYKNDPQVLVKVKEKMQIAKIISKLVVL